MRTFSDVSDVPLVCLRLISLSTTRDQRDRVHTGSMTKINWESGPRARQPYTYPSNVLPFYDLKDLENSPFVCVSTAEDGGHTDVTFLATRPELIQKSIDPLTTDIGDGVLPAENCKGVPTSNINFLFNGN